MAKLRLSVIMISTSLCAQERPVPFPGWTLPGVLTVGAAQILLKSAGQVPAKPVWIAGSGPLALLYLNQLLAEEGQQWSRISDEIGELKKHYGAKTELGRRRTAFGEAVSAVA